MKAPTKTVVLRVPRIDRKMLRGSPEIAFIFGDNMERTGLGGQAAEMRGEPNAFGVPTKWKPSNEEEAFFSDRDFDTVVPYIDDAFTQAMRYSELIVIPSAGIGTGRAKLLETAPTILEYIEVWIGWLSAPGEIETDMTGCMYKSVKSPVPPALL